MFCFPTQIKVRTQYVKDHQVLRLEHRLGLMKILKKKVFMGSQFLQIKSLLNSDIFKI